MKASIESQFGYSPLVWMFCGRQENIRIDHLHDAPPMILYNAYESTFESLLELDNSLSIHHRNIRLLSIELYKVKHNLSNQVMSELFNLRNINYYFGLQTDFELGAIYITAYGLRPLKHLLRKSGNSDNLSEFTTKIKSWKPVTCP